MHIDTLNIEQNRRDRKYSKKEKMGRALWMLIHPLFRYSPRPFFAWRCLLLRLFGASVGSHVHVYNSARIYIPWNLKIYDWASIGEHAFIYNLAKITIGAKATISYRAHLCSGSHDYEDPGMTLLKLPIAIGDQAWICTDSYVGPGVTIGEGAVVGARSVVVKDVPAWTVVAGNPAKEINKRVLKKRE